MSDRRRGKTANTSSPGASLDAVRAVVLSLPDVEESSSPRGVGWKVCGRLLACEAVHRSAEAGSLMIRIGAEERARLLREQPEMFYVTDHYRNHPAILVRSSAVSEDVLRTVLQAAWRFAREKSR